MKDLKIISSFFLLRVKIYAKLDSVLLRANVINQHVHLDNNKLIFWQEVALNVRFPQMSKQIAGKN